MAVRRSRATRRMRMLAAGLLAAAGALTVVLRVATRAGRRGAADGVAGSELTEADLQDDSASSLSLSAGLSALSEELASLSEGATTAAVGALGFSHHPQGALQSSHQDQNGSRPRGCLVALVRGAATLEGYTELRTRNAALHRRFNARFGYPSLVFHEGDVAAEHMRAMEAETPHLRFVDARRWGAFALPPFVRAGWPRYPDAKPMGYSHMCRFFSLQLWEALAELGFDYAMRFDDDVVLETDFTEDPFERMRSRQLVYAYSAEVEEWHIPTKETFFEWMAGYARGIGRAFPEDAPLTPTMFFTHFFISEVAFWRRPEVQAMLQAADYTGMIYTRRWGDAPIQTAALKLFAGAEALWHVEGLRYCHQSTGHCLQNGAMYEPDKKSKLETEVFAYAYYGDSVLARLAERAPGGALQLLRLQLPLEKRLMGVNYRDLIIREVAKCARESPEWAGKFGDRDNAELAMRCWGIEDVQLVADMDAVDKARKENDSGSVRALTERAYATRFGLDADMLASWSVDELKLWGFIRPELDEDDRNTFIGEVANVAHIADVGVVQRLSNEAMHRIVRIEWIKRGGSRQALCEAVAEASFSDSEELEKAQPCAFFSRLL